jgi:hypothetical protein
MDSRVRFDPFHGLFRCLTGADGATTITKHEAPSTTLPDPQTGRLLKVATVEVSNRSMCPACAQLGSGGFVSFVADLRLAYACPGCRRLVWLPGA